MNEQYKVGIKRQVISALRKTIKSPTYPDQDLAQKINVELEFPIIIEKYPAIYVNYIPHSIYNAGLGNYTLEVDSTGTTYLYRHWLFQGLISCQILALDPLERDEISAQLINIMAFGREDPAFQIFRKEIYDEDFVSLQFNTDYVHSGNDSSSPAPWGNENEFIYISAYSFSCIGSFFTDPNTSELIQISKINTYPYTSGMEVPTGSQDPRDQNVPWTSF